MRIGQVTGEYPPMQGGVGAFTQELSLALAELGHEVFVFTDRRAAALENADRIHLTAGAHNWRWRTLSRVRDWAHAHQLDVVNIQYQAAAYNMAPLIHILPRRIGGARVITTFHDLMVPYLFPKAGRLRYQAVLMLARGSDGVIVTNRADQQRLAAENALNNHHIPIGSNITPTLPPDYDRDATRAALGFMAGDIVVGYFGFLNASKGIDTLLRGLQLARNKNLPVRLLMIGGRTGTSDEANIPYARKVEQMSHELGITAQMQWTGFVDDVAVSAYLMAADVIALPFHDGVSFRRGSLMAALAHGCAIITTEPQVALSELQNNAALRLIPADAPEALCAAVEELAGKLELRATMGRQARELAQQFSWQRIAERTAGYFGEIIGAGD